MFCSLRVEGTLPGFEVRISDTKLISLIKVSWIHVLLHSPQAHMDVYSQVAGSLEKPPALITVTDAYDSLPVSSSGGVVRVGWGVGVCNVKL